MRTAASILLFSLIVIMTESASIIPSLPELCNKVVQKENACSRPKAKPACTRSATGMTCEKKKPCNTKERERESKCNDKEECSSCPVCYVFTLQARYELTIHYFSLKNSHPLPDENYLSSYSARVWKPPDHFCVS